MHRESARIVIRMATFKRRCEYDFRRVALEEFSDTRCQRCEFAACAMVCNLQALVHARGIRAAVRRLRNSSPRAARYARREAKPCYRLSCSLPGAVSDVNEMGCVEAA